MLNYNQVILSGNLCQDIELRQTPSGLSVARFTLAINRKSKSDKERITDFFEIVVWKQSAEFISKYAKKGDNILVCGKLQTEKWADKDGNNKSKIIIVADEVNIVSKKSDSEPLYESQTKFDEVENNDSNLPF